MPLLGLTKPLGGGNRSSGENLHLFRIYFSSDGTDIMTVSPGEIIRSLAARMSQKALFGGADWQANIGLPAMPETG